MACALSDWDHEEECRERRRVCVRLCALAVSTTATVEEVQLITVHLTCNQCTVIKNSAASAIWSLHYYKSLNLPDTQVQGINPEVNNHLGPRGSISPVFPDQGQETERISVSCARCIFFPHVSCRAPKCVPYSTKNSNAFSHDVAVT
ncbi:hypothetical protein GOODEAATRI_030225 [Goodea atripinnis]|uniref:Uncharacterized protein n=1 Tax=Goodea atripinnis TaxID=208336 RepID=A0ABV0NGE6_9TELE